MQQGKVSAFWIGKVTNVYNNWKAKQNIPCWSYINLTIFVEYLCDFFEDVFQFQN